MLQRKTLITKVRAHVKKQLGDYVKHDFITTKRGLVEFIVTSRHGNNAGILGALTLAQSAFLAAAAVGPMTYTYHLILPHILHSSAPPNPGSRCGAANPNAVAACEKLCLDAWCLKWQPAQCMTNVSCRPVVSEKTHTKSTKVIPHKIPR